MLKLDRVFEITIVIIIITVLIGLIVNKPSSSTPPTNNIKEAMEIIQSSFAGPYSITVVSESLTLLLKEYNIEPKIENYLRISDDLIKIRKLSKGKVQEMDIINDMLMAVPPDSIPILPFKEQFDKSVRKFIEE